MQQTLFSDEFVPSASLFGQLFEAKQAWKLMRSLIQRSTSAIDICSAYLRSEALEQLLDGCQCAPGSRILVRWQRSDMEFGASDFKAFDVALAHGLNFYMKLDFHGKLVSIPPSGIIIGSSNLTLSGLGLAARYNSEVCTLVNCTEENQKLVETVFIGATRVQRSLLNQMCSIAVRKLAQSTDADWPSEIMKQVNDLTPRRCLLVRDCFFSIPTWLSSNAKPKGDALHDLGLIGLAETNSPINIDRELLKQSLQKTAMFSWLLSVLQDLGGCAYFGQLSSRLHDALSDDPSPRRQEVKFLLQNLLGWICTINIGNIIVDCPNYSQRVRLISMK
jgi:PLD-like domain